MIEYITGIIFFTLFSIFMYIIGSVIIKDDERYSYKFIIGYLIYSFFVAIFGIIVQVFNLPWIMFEISMFIILISLAGFCIYKIKKFNIRIMPKDLKKFIYEHWFLFVLLLFLMFLTFFHFNSYWFNNHLDDSFYINKMSLFPYVKDAFRIIPSTGFKSASGLNPYIVNTHELEASFYIYILKMTPTLYARLFLAGFNYFLFINCIYAFAEKIMTILKIKFTKSTLQFIPGIMILFAFNELFLKNKGILFLQDSNQFANAMYYGSSIVRTMGIILLILPFLEENKINLKMILSVIGISIVLMSKSTIALPVIIATVICFTLININNNGSYGKIIQFLIIAILLVIDVMLNNNSDILSISSYSLQNFTSNITFIGMIPIIIIFIFSFFSKSKVIYKINAFYVLFFILTVLPFFNNFISCFSFYAFVAGRTFTCFYYTLCILSCIYLYIFLCSLNVKNIIMYTLSGVSIMSLSIGNVYSMEQAGGSLFYDEQLVMLDLKEAFRVIKNNNKFIPDSSLKLGEILNRLVNESKEDVNVISRELHNINGSAYALATSLTSIAPNVKSVSAKFRYGGDVNEDFKNYSSEDQLTFEKFMFEFDEEVYNEFKNILEKYPINCVILVVDDKTKYMQDMDFELYDKVIDEDAGVMYYVYKK